MPVIGPVLHRETDGDMAFAAAAVPQLANLLAISHRPNVLSTGSAVVAAPNFGQTSTMMPVDGYRFAPQLNEATGGAAAPRNTDLPDYILAPKPIQGKGIRINPALMRATQQNGLVSPPLDSVIYNPAGTASLGSGYGK